MLASAPRNLVLTISTALILLGSGARDLHSAERFSDGDAEKTMRAEILVDTSYGDREKLERAGKLVLEVLSENDQFAPAYVQVSRIILKGGYVANSKLRGAVLENAKASLERAIEVDPDYPESYVLMGHVEGLANRLIIARKHLMKAQRLGSTNPWIENNLGYLSLRTREFRKADALYAKTVERGIGETAQQRNAYVEALSMQMNIAYRNSNIERLIDLAATMTSAASPKNPWPWGGAGGMLCAAGEFDRGIEYNNKALAIRPYRAARYNEAYCLYGKWAAAVLDGERAQAQPLFDKAYELNSDIRVFADDYRYTHVGHLRKILLQEIEKK